MVLPNKNIATLSKQDWQCFFMLSYQSISRLMLSWLLYISSIGYHPQFLKWRHHFSNYMELILLITHWRFLDLGVFVIYVNMPKTSSPPNPILVCSLVIILCTKGYRCLHPPSKRVYLSRHVIFYEKIFAYVEQKLLSSPAQLNSNFFYIFRICRWLFPVFFSWALGWHPWATSWWHHTTNGCCLFTDTWGLLFHFSTAHGLHNWSCLQQRECSISSAWFIAWWAKFDKPYTN